jgi:hypothetical protein
MQKFLEELPALLITLAVLAMATTLLLTGRATNSDVITFTSPVIAFWFLGKAFSWQPAQQAPLQGVSAPQQEKQP